MKKSKNEKTGMGNAYRIAQELLKDRLKSVDPEAFRELEDIGKADVIVIGGQYDHIENVLNLAGTPHILIGPRDLERGGFLDTVEIMKKQGVAASPLSTNTVIGVVATDATLNKEQANKVAQMAHDGLARAVHPAHSMVDGDVIVALAAGKGRELGVEGVTIVGAIAAEVVATAVVRAVMMAQGLAGVPSAREVMGSV